MSAGASTWLDPLLRSRVQFVWVVAFHILLFGRKLVPRWVHLVATPTVVLYTAWAHWVFRGKVRADIGYH